MLTQVGYATWGNGTLSTNAKINDPPHHLIREALGFFSAFSRRCKFSFRGGIQTTPLNCRGVAIGNSIIWPKKHVQRHLCTSPQPPSLYVRLVSHPPTPSPETFRAQPGKIKVKRIVGLSVPLQTHLINHRDDLLEHALHLRHQHSYVIH